MKKLYFVLIGFLVFSGVEAQIINFPDANFKARLLSANSTGVSIASTQALSANGYVTTYNKIDTNNDGEISIAEASVITWLSMSGGLITDLTGIEYFTNLQYLDCNSNNLTSLNLSGVLNLKYLTCYSNNITNLNISGLTNLYSMNCSFNQLTSLDVRGLSNFGKFYCFYNQFTSLDFSGLTNLTYLDCNNNPLNSLFIKNGSVESTLKFYSIPNLQYICADEAQIASIQTQITGYGYTNCQVNSYCSFVPGGTFYTIKGNNRFDYNNNGCDATDIDYPNLKLSFTDGTNTGNLIPNATGAYQLDLQAGTQTFTPVLENPTYFYVSPTTASVTFPTTSSPFTQDFCITANGVHNDLEVTILPIGNARPGFDAHYQIVYKNRGTTTQSGSVVLTYNGAISSYVSTVPAVSSQATNSLNWSFSGLQPFETRTIDATININTPTATPPVNAGDILNYTATASAQTDETPSDNTSSMNQTVVNAFDPNDKICTEGTTVSPSMVGQYVHYIIHFENDGTANAQNIVVKDMIDTSKFDISTLVSLTGSANFTTRITNTNQVEFIFQNINLPFASGTNGGYVAFKIKTKPTLVVGDTFSNTANIYFDYNAPIVTNTATTTIAALANPEFVFSDYFTLSPIPTKGTLNITTKQDITISSISIYNTLGQVMLVTSNPSKTIDVSNLATGSYFIKVITDKGTSSGKFIKE
ncbi:MAG: T9SS type A sorting domain-containing protein [Flavobacterium sp.]